MDNKTPATIDIAMPLEQEGSTATLRAWLRQVGDVVRADEPVAELETDKVSVEVAAPADGVLAEILLPAGAQALPGTVLGRLRVGATPALSPSVRRLLAQTGIDPRSVSGTGRDGRITREDAEKASARDLTGQSAGPAPAPLAPARPDPVPQAAAPVADAAGTAHSAMRLAIAEHMVRSVATAPHVTAVFEADFGRVLAHRARHKAEFARQGAALTTTAYLVLASVRAMPSAPAVNARWHADRLEIPADIHIGIGTALGEGGLVVPVIHQAQTLSLLGVAQRLTALTEAARAGQLAPADVRGGTFTISNHGVSGSLLASPVIIVQPQSAILGVGRIEKRVVVRSVDGADAIQIRPMGYVTLTIDHRVLDGAQTSAWLTRFVEVIEGEW